MNVIYSWQIRKTTEGELSFILMKGDREIKTYKKFNDAMKAEVIRKEAGHYFLNSVIRDFYS